MPRRVSPRTLLHLALPLLLLAGLGLYYFPRSVTTAAAHANTTIHLTASRGAVLFPGDCIQMRWEVAYTLRVLANDELMPAIGEKELCIDAETQPTLQVMLMDESEVEVVQPVAIISAQPLFLALAFIALALLASGPSAVLLRAAQKTAGRESARALGRAAGIVILAILFTLLALELALSAYFRAAGNREQKIMYLYTLEEIRGLQSNIVPLPYISWAPDPAYDGHNALGYRGPEIAIPKPAQVFRIVAMGGSTTYSTGTPAEESYPAFLEAILRGEYGYANIEVINAGVSGYTSWDVLPAYAFRVVELEPDMLIYYGAVNDLVARERNSVDCYRGLNPLRGLDANRGLFVERNSPLPASALYRLLAIQLGWMNNPLALESSFEPSRIKCEPDPGGFTLEQRLVANPPYYYERNLRGLATLAQSQGVQPIFSSWIYNVRADRPPLWKQSIAEHNAVTRQLASDMEIPYLDLAAEFPTEGVDWEIDGIHLLASGNRELAGRFAAFLDERALLPNPAE